MRGADGSWAPSPGGLVRALLPMLRDVGGAWVGWTGVVDDDAEPFTLDGVELYPVQLSPGEHDDYYEGFSNDSLWPLYHDAVRESTFKSQQWDAYVAVNERFADRLAEVAPPGAVIWVHDYHLQLVPAMIRERRPDAVDRLLPAHPVPAVGAVRPPAVAQRDHRGPARCRPRRLPAADGRRELRLDRRSASALAEPVTGEVRVSEPNAPAVLEAPDGRPVKIGAFPISIDVAEFNDVAAERNVRRASAALRSRLGNPEVVLLGVDRLDYTKGIGARMRAFRVAARRRHARRRPLRDDPGRHADPRGGRALPGRAPRDRAPRRRDQRPPRPHRPAGAPLPVPLAAARGPRRPLPRRRRDARDAAARRDEPRRQGVRRLAARRQRRARAVGVRRRRRPAHRRRARQPPRRRRDARGDRPRHRDEPHRADAADGGAARRRRPQRRAGWAERFLDDLTGGSLGTPPEDGT